MTVTRTYRFHEVFRKKFRRSISVAGGSAEPEVALELEPRREFCQSRTRVPSSGEARSSTARPANGEAQGLAGLALSGGGIRSASFCLGALQALDKAGVLKNIDYLSTVSGGGYIGTSLSAAMTHSKGDFPFTSSLTQDEPYPVQHIRNHSNYLFPRGASTSSTTSRSISVGCSPTRLLILPWLLRRWRPSQSFSNRIRKACTSRFAAPLFPKRLMPIISVLL